MTDEEIQEIREKFTARIEALEKALSVVYPGWEWGAHEPGCTCAACEY